MFRVENADFIADKLASELLPNQEYREAAKNSLEAIARRYYEADGSSRAGRIEFDVDWHMLEQTGEWLLACSDNGDGMTRTELERYTTTLAVQGANRNQTVFGNQGMGLKISGPTRHKRGVLIRSLKAGQRSMVQIGWDGHEYNLIPLGPNNELVIPARADAFPDFINEAGAGTVVTFLGNEIGQNTFAPTDRPRSWLFKYMHQRFNRLTDDDGQLLVRVASGDEEDWPRNAAEAADRQRGQGGKSFNLSRVRGTAAIWDDASERIGADYHGAADVSGDPSLSIPSARVHWWVLPEGPGSDVSTRTSSGGSLAVLFQNELHDWRTGSQANPYFARMGVLFGKSRITFVFEPLGGTVASDFARAHVLVNSTPVLESDAWLLWAEQFRQSMPDKIRETMEAEQARLQEEDPNRAKRIRERLKDVMRLLRPRRFRPTPDGRERVGGPEIAGPGDGEGDVNERRRGPGHHRNGSGHRGIGAVLAQLNDDGEAATEVFSSPDLTVNWVSERDASNTPLVSDDGNGLHDRAAGLVGEDGISASILLMNHEFRGYQTVLAAVNEWANPEGDESKASLIESYAQEWIEQKMMEAIAGLRQLENGSTWLASNYSEALSPVGLTAVFMADRYHTLREVRRQAGSLAGRPITAASPDNGA